GEIRDHLRLGGPVKTPRALQSKAILVRRAAEELERASGESPRLSALCRATGLTAEEVTEALQASVRPLSLEAALTEDGGGSLLDCLPAASVDDPAEQLDLAEAVRTLEPPLRQVIALRYGRDLTQRQVSRVMGVTQGQISRLEKRALNRLREKLT
ncbi:MAG: sigma-70 family RNA polymerase sigma factor, partial [Clostridia bacterium]|nr:sigma-70 family RNA polymerase sigma factor [Clostridia bacterium]